MLINEKLNKICLIFLGLKGDLLLRMPIVDSIKEKFPDIVISVVVDNNNLNVVDNHPDIDKVITLDRNKLSRYQYIKNNLNVVFKLRREKFDAVINFYGGGASNFIVRASNIKYRIGFNHTKSLRLANNIPIDSPDMPNEHWMPYLAHLLLPLGIEPESVKKGATFHITDYGKEQAKKILKKHQKEKLILLNLGASVKHKCLSIKSFAELSLKLHDLYNTVPVVLTNPGMESLTTEYIDLIDNKIDVVHIPLTPFDTEAAIMQQCDVIITADTSLMHLAIALEKQTLALFFETNPANVSPDKPWYGVCDLRKTKQEQYIENIIKDYIKLTNDTL